MSERPFVIPINVLDGVHNYCHRWCERCRFTARCTVYVNAHPDSPEAKDTVPFEPVMSPELREELEKAGAFDEPTPAEMREFERQEQRRRTRVKAEPALALAEAYVTAAEVAFGELGALEHPALEVLRHYHFFVGAKVYRAMHGLHSDDFDPLDLESDAYGSAKAALTAMDDMMAAWLAIGSVAPPTAELNEAVEILGKARATLEAALPRSREFVRPGFDE